MAKSTKITREISEEVIYDVLKVLDDGRTEKIGVYSAKGKFSNKDLAEKVGVSKVLTIPRKRKMVTYAMEVEDFMTLATPIKEKTIDIK